jgi:hypothetical protein
VPVLPVIDLLILVGWTSLGVGAVLKAVAITTVYRPTLLSLTSMDFVIVSGICFGFALTLAARTWVKLNEPRLMALSRREADFKERRLAMERALDEAEPPSAGVSSLHPDEASAGHR